jgi:ABC-2 type transport system ATP-binding protein
LLVVDGLTKRFGSRTAVDGVSFTVAPGTILGLVGPNGAGKTTTLTAIAGFLPPTAGRILWEGDPPWEQAGLIGYMPETPEVYPLLTVWEHLEFVARLFRLQEGWRARAGDLLQAWDLAPHRDTFGTHLSKGLRQRLIMATMALRGARLLLVDEPMIGLDPKGQREVRDLLLTFRAEGAAVILSSHQLGLIEQVADDVVIMARGHMVAHDTVAGLMRRLDGQGHSLEDVLLTLTEQE